MALFLVGICSLCLDLLYIQEMKRNPVMNPVTHQSLKYLYINWFNCAVRSRDMLSIRCHYLLAGGVDMSRSCKLSANTLDDCYVILTHEVPNRMYPIITVDTLTCFVGQHTRLYLYDSQIKTNRYYKARSLFQVFYHNFHSKSSISTLSRKTVRHRHCLSILYELGIN